MDSSPSDMHERRALRERAARKAAEALLEQKSLELFQANKELRNARDDLEIRVAERTRELRALNGELESARDHAEEAARAKTDFLANMSHEIRTPMTAILGYAQILAEDPLDPRKQASLVDVIRRNGEHLLALLNDILDFSKIGAGQVEIERIPVSIEAALNDACDLMRLRAEDSGLGVEIERDRGLPEWVSLDPTRLRQILTNLIGNAIKFTSEGCITLRVSWSADLLTIAVEDTGVGIPQSRLQDIFGSFQQADASTSRQFGGTGLGLAISRRLAQLLGGDIDVRSEVGVGSCFTVTVEAEETEPEVSPQSTNEREATPAVDPKSETFLEGLRVLFADDGPDNRVLIAHVLSRSGCEVDLVEDGQQALDTVLSNPNAYHLVVLDMQMPVMDGFEAAQALRDAGYQKPILAMTAHVLPTDRRRCLDAGCDGYVSKPVDFVELRAKVHELGRAGASKS